MKSERQQNQESDLIADKIENTLVKVKQSLPQILLAVGLVVVALLGWGIYSSINSSKMARAWTALYFSDTTPSDLTSIANDFSGTDAELWARQIAGDSHLSKGVETVFSNRDASAKHFENAIDEYKIVSSKASSGLLATRSLWGLAQAQEGLGDRSEAAATYKKVIRVQDAEPTLVAEATRRAAWLESDDGEAFYVWFKENKPSVPALPQLPTGEKPAVPDKPTFDINIPAVEPAVNPAGAELPTESSPSKEPTSKEETSLSPSINLSNPTPEATAPKIELPSGLPKADSPTAPQSDKPQ